MNFNFLTKKTLKDVDLHQLIGNFGRRTTFTPDAAILSRKESHLFFIADEMMEKHYDYARLGAEATNICQVLTQDKFSYWKKNLGKKSFALALENGYTEKRQIRGELHLLLTEQIFKLDEHRENGVQYDRKRVKLILPYTQTQMKYQQMGFVLEDVPLMDKTINAWMYVGRSEYWDKLLDGGYMFSPVKHFTPHNPLLQQYYYFTNREYDETTRDPRTVLRLR